MPYASLDNPQTLNLYAYVENGPLSRADADGHAGQQLGTYATNLTCLSPGCLEGLTSSTSPDANLQGNAGLNAAIYEATSQAQVQQALASTGNNIAQQQSAPAATVPLTLPPLIFPSLEGVGNLLGGFFDTLGGLLGDAAVPLVILAKPASTANESQDTIQQKGPKAADAPGITVGGQATDRHGNKRGPSGQPHKGVRNS